VRPGPECGQSFRERFWSSLWRFGVARFARLYPLYLAIGLFILLWRNWAKLPTELPDAWALASARRILPPAGQDHRRGEPSSGSCDQLSAFRDVLSAQLAFFSAASTAALSGQIAALS
jgi:hypothetical protein